jgi:hypothetical protein
MELKIVQIDNPDQLNRVWDIAFHQNIKTCMSA